MILDRRSVLAGGALLGTMLAAPALAKGVARVVVLGGGAGGASAARALKRLGGDRVAVTLIDQSATYTTCFFSNWVIAGLRSVDDIRHGYDRLAAEGVSFVPARAEAIDRDEGTVVLSDKTRIAYDRLVVSPGISFDYAGLPGFSEAASEAMPHAWKAGPQTVELKRRLDALEDGQSILMVVPGNPYRCPPGPYERASLMAHVLATTGRKRSRITILDAKEKFSKQALFMDAWERLTPGMIEWLPPSVHGGITGIEEGKVLTGLDDFAADFTSVIPPQKAGVIALSAGLADESGWCPVAADSLRSPKDERIFVIGDASAAGEMPKSATSANSQAKLAAVQILADLLDVPRPAPRLFNTCWSLVAPGNAVKVGALYRPRDGKIAAEHAFVSEPAEPPAARERSAVEAEDWYRAITADMFG